MGNIHSVLLCICKERKKAPCLQRRAPTNRLWRKIENKIDFETRSLEHFSKLLFCLKKLLFSFIFYMFGFIQCFSKCHSAEGRQAELCFAEYHSA
jgi:hypothetical protein